MARLIVPSALRQAATVMLRPYARVFFAADAITGALILAAVATAPWLALATIAAMLMAQLLVRVSGLGMAAVLDGTIACSAILSVLAMGYTLGAVSLPVFVSVVVLAVVSTAALQALLGRVNLPPLAFPFVVTAWVVLLVSRVLPAERVLAAAGDPSMTAAWVWLPAAWTAKATWLDIPAALLYQHGALAGLLLVLALAWHSRISLLLAGVGAVTAFALHIWLRPAVAWSELDTTATFNGMLTAVALGGVFFVPHLSSIVLAATGAALATLITYAVAIPLGMLALPTLALPFVLATWLMLLTMRMREQDRLPASSLPAETPEEALTRHLMRVRRFGEFAWLPFRLPFRGSWLVTQGHDGPHTHKGAWRYAFDFEMRGSDGKTYEGDGRELADYRCYGIPVLAAGAGVVEQVVDGVPDNAVNGVNARENWGNVVIIAHGGALHSVYAHLRPGSIGVRAGDRVSAGAEVGRCGNSGRSLVPHLHFQVQRGSVLGGDTVPADFGDVVRRSDEVVTIASRLVPREGDVVRPVLRDETIARALSFAPGSNWRLTDTISGRQEVARVEVDLWSRHVLRTESAALYLEPYDAGLVLMAFDGAHDSLLRYVLLAMARLSFDQESTLSWRDRVPRRLLLTLPWSLLDLVAMIAPRFTDVEISYHARRTERSLVVDGAAGSLATRAEISLAGEPHRFSIFDASGALRTAVTLERIPNTVSGEQSA